MQITSEVFEYREISFSGLEGKNILVFLTHLNYLEIPWTLETSLRLWKSGAIVSVIDISWISEIYSQRISLGPFHLPFFTKRLIRSLIFSKKSRMEIRLEKIISDKGMEYTKIRRPWIFPILAFGRKRLNKYDGVSWGGVSALSILHTVFSSYLRRNVDLNEEFKLNEILQIKKSLVVGKDAIDKIIQNYSPYQVYVANGRMPTPALVTSVFRNLNVPVILFEAGGGYIFPEISDKRIEYWHTSPHNELETQSKILNFISHKSNEYLLGGKEYFDILKHRKSIPYSTLYLSNELSKPLNLENLNYVCFFSSGDWEFNVNIGITQDEKLRLGTKFESQISFIESLLDELTNTEKLIIRLHPRDPGINSTQEKYWDRFQNHQQVILIGNDSKVDSYSLASKARANFVWSSILGLEFGARNLPVAITGNAIYAAAFPENWIRNKTELKRFLQEPKSLKREKIVQVLTYYRYGGYLMENSLTTQNRSVYLLNKLTDVPNIKIPFSKLYDKFH